MNPTLPTSYKNRFPFRLGTTSYIIPGSYATNVALLAPFLDEIELLFFESHQDAWPSTAEREELVRLADRYSLRYNIHLPLDLRLGHAKAPVRTAAVEILIRLFDLTGPLTPTTWTLHLPMEDDGNDKETIFAWRHRVTDSLRQLIDAGIPPRAVTLENIDYSIETIGELSQQTGFRMCLDAGHLIAQRVNVPATFDRFRDRIDMVHLHGVRNGKDHLSLAVLQDTDCRWIPDMLASFTGTVSLEVFSYESLVTSLDFFETLWENRFDEARRHMVGSTGR